MSNTSKTNTIKPARPTKYGPQADKAEEGLGGLREVSGVMRDPVAMPCVECPFRKDSTPGHLGGYTPEMYAQVVYSPASVACHMSPDFDKPEIHRSNHCTGLAVIRSRLNYPREPRAYGAQDAVAHVADNPHPSHDNVFDDLATFHNHHSAGQK